MPVGGQAQQVSLPRGERGGRRSAAFGVEVGLVEVGPYQGEQGPVPFGEVRAGEAEEAQPDAPAGSAARPRRFGQAELEVVLQALRRVHVGIYAGGMPLPVPLEK